MRTLRGGHESAGLEEAQAEDLPEEYRDLPPFFTEILVEVLRHKRVLGGLRSFPAYPRIDHKVKAEEFRHGYTDFEYVYLTVLGFARLHTHGEEIVGKCNGRVHTQNPGVQQLEVMCGMTMHGDRDGAKALLRNAPSSLLEAYRLAKQGHHRKLGTTVFFKEAFDRTADPCLEGRLGRIYEFLEKARKFGTKSTEAPWEDVSLQPLAASASANDVVGEHLRVFINECTWRWAQDKGLDYEAAKLARDADAHAAEFGRLYNADTFRAAMQARGVAPRSEEKERCMVQWEVQTDDKSWVPFEEGANLKIVAARQRAQLQIELRQGPKGWTYMVDLRKFVQRNPSTGKERSIRCVRATPDARFKDGKGHGGKGGGSKDAAAASAPSGMRQLKPEELEKAIAFFVELDTLSAAPV